MPVMPCSNADELVDFYQKLGFELIGKYVRSYIVLRYEELELHFYGTKRVLLENNSCMCIVQTDNLEKLQSKFSDGLKSFSGEIRRTGFPRISKIRSLSDDMRFTMSDPSGNTFYILTPKQAGAVNFFRDLENIEYADSFKILYDLIYSKEDAKVAGNMLPKLVAIKDKLNDFDKAKLLLVAIEIDKNLEYENELRALIASNILSDNINWIAIEQRLGEVLN